MCCLAHNGIPFYFSYLPLLLLPLFSVVCVAGVAAFDGVFCVTRGRAGHADNGVSPALCTTKNTGLTDFVMGSLPYLFLRLLFDVFFRLCVTLGVGGLLVSFSKRLAICNSLKTFSFFRVLRWRIFSADSVSIEI